MKLKTVKRSILKLFIIMIVVGVTAGIYSIFINSYVKASARKDVYSHENITDIAVGGLTGSIIIEDGKTYDAIIVLGARVFSEESVSTILRDRLEIGYEAYKNGLSKKIIVSGDHATEGYDEVIAMKRYLMEKGVAREDIFMDHAGINTYDSMYRAKHIFGVESAVVITQEFHAYRAAYIGNHLGIETIGITSNLSGNYRAANDVREYLARNKAFLDTEVFPRKSKYLGEQISIHTNTGLDTEDDKAKEIFDKMLDDGI